MDAVKGYECDPRELLEAPPSDVIAHLFLSVHMPPTATGPPASPVFFVLLLSVNDHGTGRVLLCGDLTPCPLGTTESFSSAHSRCSVLSRSTYVECSCFRL